MASTFLNISTDTTLGGNSPSDAVVSSQKAIKTKIDTKQDTLVSGTNIKTVGGTSLLGSGNISLPTKTSDLTNDSGYLTDSDTVTTTEVTLATVATSGSYNDLSNKPTIPAAQVQSDWNATTGMGVILNKPTIPTVNNATLTIQKNGSNVATFTANASSNVTANISVPTDTNDLTNGAGFITNSALSGYQTTANLVTSVSSSSTDSQYPSAKLFYDTVGDIESVLHTINSGVTTVNLTIKITGDTSFLDTFTLGETIYTSQDFEFVTGGMQLIVSVPQNETLNWSITATYATCSPSSGSVYTDEDKTIIISIMAD